MLSGANAACDDSSAVASSRTSKWNRRTRELRGDVRNPPPSLSLIARKGTMRSVLAPPVVSFSSENVRSAVPVPKPIR